MKASNRSFSQSLTYKIFFTLFILLVFRFGSFIPIAGVDSGALLELAKQNQSGILGMFNMLSGGSLERMSIFALALVPYITSSIIIQLMTVIYKPLEEMKKEGGSGRKKLNQFSRYLTVLLATFQAYGVSVSLESFSSPTMGTVVNNPGVFFKLCTIITLVSGTMFLMWLSEQVTQKGIGNGSSLIIFVGITSGIPSSVINMFELARKGAISSYTVFFVFSLVITTIAVVVFFEKAYRKVLVQYPKRQVGNKIYSGDSTHLPLRLNTAGVVPPIFASSVLLFPTTIANLSSKNSSLLDSISYHLGHGKPIYIALYVLLIGFFAFFYTAVVFNSEETADNLKKNGAYLPGIRPGKNTKEYLDYLLSRLTVLGVAYLTFICVTPEILMNKYSLSFTLGGTSFLIVVNVILDTFTQIQNYLFNNKYENLIKKMKLKGKI